MRNLLVPTLVAAALAPLLSGASGPAPSGARTQEANDPFETTGPDALAESAEDAEVMRRLLVKSLSTSDAPGQVMRSDTFFESYSAAVGALQLSSKGGVSHSRAFVVPGDGVLITLDVQVPTRQVPVEPEHAEPDHDDAWAEARREVLGNASGRRDALLSPRSDTALALDDERIAEIQVALATTLRRHASRIRGLSPRDSVTVAVHLTPVLHRSSWIVSDDEEELDEDGRFPSVRSSWPLLLNAPAPERLVLRANVGDLREDYIDDVPTRSTTEDPDIRAQRY